MTIPITDWDITQAMTSMGGSFAAALAEAYRCADQFHQERIKAAFPELWAHYTDLARLRQVNRK